MIFWSFTTLIIRWHHLMLLMLFLYGWLGFVWGNMVVEWIECMGGARCHVFTVLVYNFWYFLKFAQLWLYIWHNCDEKWFGTLVSCFMWGQTSIFKLDLVVSIGRLTAFYVIFVPLEHILSEPPHFTKVIALFWYFYWELRGVANISSASPLRRWVKPYRYLCLKRE